MLQCSEEGEVRLFDDKSVKELCGTCEYQNNHTAKYCYHFQRKEFILVSGQSFGNVFELHSLNANVPDDCLNR
jgi:hypothetical protein